MVEHEAEPGAREDALAVPVELVEGGVEGGLLPQQGVLLEQLHLRGVRAVGLGLGLGLGLEP